MKQREHHNSTLKNHKKIPTLLRPSTFLVVVVIVTLLLLCVLQWFESEHFGIPWTDFLDGKTRGEKREQGDVRGGSVCCYFLFIFFPILEALASLH